MHKSRIGELPKIRYFRVAICLCVKTSLMQEIFHARSVSGIGHVCIGDRPREKRFSRGFAARAAAFGRRSEVFLSAAREKKSSGTQDTLKRVFVKNHSY